MKKLLNEIIFPVPVQTSDTCNFYNTFEKETWAGNCVASECDCNQLFPRLCAKMFLNHWWFLRVEQGRWGWLTESYVWYTSGVPTIPTLICKKIISRRNGGVCAKGEAVCFMFRTAGDPSNSTVLQMRNDISCSVGPWVDLTIFSQTTWPFSSTSGHRCDGKISLLKTRAIMYYREKPVWSNKHRNMQTQPPLFTPNTNYNKCQESRNIAQCKLFTLNREF